MSQIKEAMHDNIIENMVAPGDLEPGEMIIDEDKLNQLLMHLKELHFRAEHYNEHTEAKEVFAELIKDTERIYLNAR